MESNWESSKHRQACLEKYNETKGKCPTSAPAPSQWVVSPHPSPQLSCTTDSAKPTSQQKHPYWSCLLTPVWQGCSLSLECTLKADSHTQHQPGFHPCRVDVSRKVVSVQLLMNTAHRMIKLPTDASMQIQNLGGSSLRMERKIKLTGNSRDYPGLGR